MNKYVTFGEIMLRLKSPSNERLFQSPSLEATFGGGEGNVAVSLSRFGEEAHFITALPDNDLGMHCTEEIRKHGVLTDGVKYVKDSRLGIYYLETGSCQRPSKVVYDRAYSAFSETTGYDFDEVMKGATWFHISGISPAVSQIAADESLRAMKAAKAAGATVSIDLNYRKKLWKYGKDTVTVMRELTRYADVIIANEEDIQKCLGIASDSDVTSGELDVSSYEKLADEVKKQFSNVSTVAITLRESQSANHNDWSAVISGKTGFYHSKKYEIKNIVDRVGGGDSFSAGIIYGLTHYENEETALNFAVAASALKHTIPGDFNLTSLSEVESLMGGDGSGRVQR
ncbi:MAG: sugar kinase [Sphaerochaetaceae bacterium]|jgi:2-dehydro-3-deoxygluconokinase|nr:sugar kinase [Sphaerochaetaceae bacterium]